MTCKEIEELLSAYMDNVLDRESVCVVEEHLAGCNSCRAELENLQTTVEILRSLPEIEPPAHFKEGLLEKLAGEEKKVLEISSKKQKSRNWLPVAAVAAVMFLVVALGQIITQLGFFDANFLRMGSQAPESRQLAQFDMAVEESMNNYVDAAGSLPEEKARLEIQGQGEISQFTLDSPPRLMTGESLREPAVADRGEPGIMPELPAAFERKIINNANLDLEVAAYQAAVRKIEDITVSLGGYVQDSSHSVSQQGTYSGQLMLRIPQQHFVSAVEQVEDLGRVKNRRLLGQDVTMEYYDLEGRLRVAREKESRLLDLLNKAERMEDVLSIERELGYTRSEIEHFLGQLRYYTQMTQLATINLTMRESTLSTEVFISPGLPGIIQRAGEAFVLTTNKMIALIGELVVLGGASLPVVVVLVIALALILIIIRRKGLRFKK